MALSLEERAARDIKKLQDGLEKLAPRHDRAKASIEKKRALHEKRAGQLEDAEAKFAKLDEKKVKAERYIAALQAAISVDQAGPEGESLDVDALIQDIQSDEAVAEDEAEVEVL